MYIKIGEIVLNSRLLARFKVWYFENRHKSYRRTVMAIAFIQMLIQYLHNSNLEVLFSWKK